MVATLIAEQLMAQLERTRFVVLKRPPRMEEAISCGADVPELATLTIDPIIAECVSLHELRPAQPSVPGRVC
jgi:hypothetical protein